MVVIDVLTSDDGEDLHRYFGRVATIEHKCTMRIDQVSAVRASEQGSRGEEVLIGESVPDVELFLQITAAPRALKLPVEGIELLGLRTEFILEPFYEFQGNCWVQFFEDTHSRMVATQANSVNSNRGAYA